VKESTVAKTTKSVKTVLNRQDVIDTLAKKTDVPKSQITMIVTGMFDIITANLKKGNAVHFRGFGKFLRVSRRARKARNPQTGATLKVPARKAVKFQVGTELARTIAG
jgi:DNA-binding protein HU-beta